MAGAGFFGGGVLAPVPSAGAIIKAITIINILIILNIQFINGGEGTYFFRFAKNERHFFTLSVKVVLISFKN